MINLKDQIYIGTAAWSIPKVYQSLFDAEGTHLQKYSVKLNAVEINTSFYRDHQSKTYEKWASAVPDHFRYAVKISKIFTHEQRLKNGEKDLTESILAILKLQPKLGCLLIQLPPSLSYVAQDAESFFSDLRKIYTGPIAFEPRHSSWAGTQACQVLKQHHISKVIADPISYPEALVESADSDLIYYRLHGSPEIYKSNYDEQRLQMYANKILTHFKNKKQVWCIFDNTTFGFATGNALRLTEIIQQKIK